MFDRQSNVFKWWLTIWIRKLVIRVGRFDVWSIILCLQKMTDQPSIATGAQSATHVHFHHIRPFRLFQEMEILRAWTLVLKKIAKISEAEVDSMLQAVLGSCRCSALWPLVNQYCYEQAKQLHWVHFSGVIEQIIHRVLDQIVKTQENTKTFSAHK